MLNPIVIKARDLPDAWFQCISEILVPGQSRKRKVDEGSYKGEYRLEFDFILIHITHPGNTPLIPDIPAHVGIPNPVESVDYIEQYFARYLMSNVKEGNEQYTYGERITQGDTFHLINIKGVHDHLYEDPYRVHKINQMDKIIERYKKYGHGNNQLIIQIGAPGDILLKDPPCLRHIDTRIEEGKLHFHVYFRSWDLWGGLPANLAGIQLMKEYMAKEIGVEDGEMTCTSKGLHLYGYTWDIAGKRRGLTEEEMKKFKESL